MIKVRKTIPKADIDNLKKANKREKSDGKGNHDHFMETKVKAIQRVKIPESKVPINDRKTALPVDKLPPPEKEKKCGNMHKGHKGHKGEKDPTRKGRHGRHGRDPEPCPDIPKPHPGPSPDPTPGPIIPPRPRPIPPPVVIVPPGREPPPRDPSPGPIPPPGHRPPPVPIEVQPEPDPAKPPTIKKRWPKPPEQPSEPPPPPPMRDVWSSRVGYFMTLSDLQWYEIEPAVIEAPSVTIDFADEANEYLLLKEGQSWISDWYDQGIIRGLDVSVHGTHTLNYAMNGGFET